MMPYCRSMSARNLLRRRQLIIQIDGLSRPALERAMHAGDAPRLAALAAGVEHDLVSVYSGLPSTTPAAQGELFYGRVVAVPAFAFLHERHSPRHMMDPASVSEVQAGLETDGAGLLKGGSCYCNLYSGGADQSRFCPAAAARPPNADPRGLAFQLSSIGAYAGVGLRAGGMVIGEGARLLLAGRGIRRAGFRDRLKRSWERIVFCVVLRDSARMAASRDIRSGVPVVHLNFLGWDVQSHRYGPGSRPARRALKGIDHAIAILLREFRRHAGADGTVVVYSDHGQEHTTPLCERVGAPIESLLMDACSAVAPSAPATPTPGASAPERPRPPSRFGETLLGVGTATATDAHGRTVTTVESGPIAHTYIEPRPPATDLSSIASEAASRAGVVALIVNEASAGYPAFFGESGRGAPLERLCDARLVTHPFRARIASDLQRLLRHPDAGDLVLLGTGLTTTPVTFADELGSHGGPGPLETHAFAIVPHRVNLGAAGGGVRLSDLREALIADRQA